MKIVVLMLFNVLVVSSCSRYVEYRDDPAPRQQPDEQWTNVVGPVVDARCAACHQQAAFIRSGAKFKASAAKAKILNGTMPPRGSEQSNSFTTQEKELLLDY